MPVNPRRFIRKSIHAAILCFLLTGVAYSATPAGNAFPVLWKESYDLDVANDALATDTGFDGRAEIILTDNAGQVLAIDAASGRQLWRQSVGKVPLSSPLSGNFLGAGMQEVLVCGSDGLIRVFNQATGNMVCEVKAPFAPFVHPTLLPSDAVGGRPAGSGTDRIILINDSGQVVCGRIKDSNEFVTLWSFQSRTQLRAPASVGTIRGAGQYDVVLADYSGVLTVLKGADGKEVTSLALPANYILSSGMALGQMDGPADQEEILLADEKGYLIALKSNAARLEPVWKSTVSVLGNPLKTLAAVELNDDGVVDVVAAHHGDVIFVDGLTSERFQWSAINPPIRTMPVVVTGSDGSRYAFVIDSQGTFYAIAIEGRSARTVAEIRAGGDFQETIVATAVGADRRISILTIRNNGDAVCYQTPLTSRQDSPVLWATFGGSMLRSGNRGAEVDVRRASAIAARTSALASAIGAMNELAKEGKWKESRLQAAKVLSLDPSNAEAAAIESKAATKARMPYYIIGAILFIVLAYLIGRPLYRLQWRRMQMKHGDEAMRDGQFDRAREIFSRLQERYPQDKDINAQLAIAYMKQGDFSEATIPTYERMHQRSPENLPILQALARAYLNANRQDDQALDIFVKASDQFDEPGRLNHALGAIYHERGDDKASLAFLRKAMREDYKPHELIHLVADVYLNLDVRAAAAIPVYESASAARPQDTRLLLALAESYAARQQADEKAEEVYERLIELQPEHVGIRLMLGRIKLREGAHDEAIRHAQAVLEVAPETAEALAIQAQSCIAAARADEAALAIYRKAAATFSDDNTLLKSVAHIFLENKIGDAEALRLIQLAWRKNSSDAMLARAVHDIAAAGGDKALAIETGEMLAGAGEADAALWQELAEYYCENNSRGELVETALRQAMAFDGQDPRILEMLGAIYAESERVDANALAVYEKLSQEGKLAADVGARFIQALLQSNRIAEACTHAHALLERHPHDETLHRLSARASMESNQVDEALREYEALLASHPDDAEAVVQLANAYARKNRLDDSAMLLYAHAQQVAPDEPLFPIMKARMLGESGNWMATTEVLKSTALKSQQAGIMVHEEVQKLLTANPSALPLRWMAFQMALAMSRCNDALEHIVIIQERDPKQTTQAVEALDKIILKDQHCTLAFFHRGRMLRQLERYDEARSSLETAITLMPNDQRVQSELAAIYDQILKDNPAASDADDLRFRLGKLAVGLKMYDKAIQCFQVCAQDFRYETESIRYLAQCFMAKGMLDLALQEFKKLHIDGEVKDLLYELAQRYEAKHDLVGAKTVYRQLFAADIGYRNVREKFEMLAGTTSDPMIFEKTSILNSLSEEAKRRYELVEEIGRGAMGIVYKAHDNELNEIVALKILPDNLSNNPEALMRFKAEARSARRLAHPNIVRIHDIGEEMGRKYISMEFVEGTDLKKLLRTKGTPSFEETLVYARQVCAAIAYAHGEGIIHRDIKPANIMLTKDDRIKVTDFGIAKVCESQDHTLAGAIMGTPLYMSPEQVQGLVVDNRTDIYSLGILFYELLNGRPPFTEGDLAYQHMHVEPKPLEQAPSAFWSVISRALQKNREDRWPNVDEMLSALMKAD